MSERCFEVSLKLDNIGPHSGGAKLDFHEKMPEHCLAVYAPNGAGKTFISRMYYSKCTTHLRRIATSCCRFAFNLGILEATLHN